MDGLDLESNTPIPIGIRDWMDSSHKFGVSSSNQNYYLESGIHLAWLLTKHLRKLGRVAIARPPEITADNVILFVDTQTKLHIRAVKFRFEVRGVLPLLSVLDHADMNYLEQATPPESEDSDLESSTSSNPSPGDPAVCASLGQILLEIFSMGQSSRALEISHDGRNNSGVIVPNCREESSNGSTLSTRAKNLLLLGLGRPLSICRLVCDLLDAANKPRPKSALTSLNEAEWDLFQMKSHPERFLFDELCPQKALERTGLFGSSDRHNLFGREKEMEILFNAKKKVAEHVQSGNDTESNKDAMHLDKENYFRCNAVFLSGCAGIGKSSLLQNLIQSSKEEKWFVLECKFDDSVAPHQVLAKAFDDFFGKWDKLRDEYSTSATLDSAMMQILQKICQCIFSKLDSEGFAQLCALVPSFARMFPLLRPRTDQAAISSMDNVGAAAKRHMQLFHLLIKSLCSSGCPVLIALDDLHHWASFAMDVVVSYILDDNLLQDSCQGGLLVAGTFRTNEVNAHIKNQINALDQSKKAIVTNLKIENVAEDEVTRMISSLLALPLRYTRELAALVHNKTAGGIPLFVNQFIASIIQNKMLEFSQDSCQWVWDCDTIEFQMISDGVAELLTQRFSQLPRKLMQTLMIISCLGSQVEESTLEVLNFDHQVLPFDMHDELQLAIAEGIVEKAGPMYQFVHDTLEQAVYGLIPTANKKLLHKDIADKLLKSMLKDSSATNDTTLYLLTADQINKFCKDCDLSQVERSQYAQVNTIAAQSALELCSFEQARLFINTGMQLLEPTHWDTQYELSLTLYEMSAKLSYKDGNAETMSSCLDEILLHIRTFEDGLIASSLLVKLLGSTSHYKEAITNCLDILSKLGEDFPQDIMPNLMMQEMSEIAESLKNVTPDDLKKLPPMKDKQKLHAMNFMSMLCSYSSISKPILIPLVSSRMVRLTVKFGFCEDSIIGLIMTGYGVFTFLEGEMKTGYRIGKLGESLIEDMPNRNIIKARLCRELGSTMKVVIEPSVSFVATYPALYNMGMLAGDVESSVICLQHYCVASFYTGANLLSLSNTLVKSMKEAAKYKQSNVHYVLMTISIATMNLMGRAPIFDEIRMKNLDELYEIAKETANKFLSWQVHLCRVTIHFWNREYAEALELIEKYKVAGHKRILEVSRILFEGVSALILARQTKQPKYRDIGEKAVQKMSKMAVVSECNFGHALSCLQAELHFLNGDLESAEANYQSSIVSAQKQKFLRNEYLFRELYGRFCLENQMTEKGLEQLNIALEKYKQCGALKRAHTLKLLIDSMSRYAC